MSKYQLWANVRVAKDHNKLIGKPLKEHIFNELDYLTFDPRPVQFKTLFKKTETRVNFNSSISKLKFSYEDPTLDEIEKLDCSYPQLEQKIDAMYINFNFLDLDFSIREISTTESFQIISKY